MSKWRLISALAVFCLAVSFIWWSYHLLHDVNQRQREVRRRVVLISQLNRLRRNIGGLEALVRKQPSMPATKFAKTWDTQHQQFEALRVRLLRSPLIVQQARQQILHMASLFRGFLPGRDMHSPGTWKRLHDARELCDDRLQRNIRGLRGQLGRISVALALRWKQLHWLTWISGGLAILVALMFLFSLHYLKLLSLREGELLRAQERYSLSAMGANDGLWDWNLLSHEVFYSRQWKAMLGYEEHEFGDHADVWRAHIHHEDRLRFEESWAAHLAGEADFFVCEHRLQTKRGHYLWVLCHGLAQTVDGVPVRAAGSLTDLEGRDSFHDVLTGLPNRRLLLEQLERNLRLAKEHSNALFALLFMDLDRFKQINDTMGHLAGDQLLLKIARRLESCMGSHGLVARLGGDEFCFLLSDLHSHAEAMNFAEQIISSFQTPFEIDGQTIFSSTSIGIAFYESKEQTAEYLLRNADLAMYKAKEQGKSQYACFDEVLHQQIAVRLQLETELRWAIERAQFFLVLQPIVEVATRQIVGAEALLRWQHPTRGVLAPQDFLPILEETGMMPQVGSFVLTSAFEKLSTWQKDGTVSQEFRLHVNLSTREFVHPGLLEEIATLCEMYPISKDSLCLELTESAVMGKEESALPQLKALRSLGLSLSINDFGAGHSSLSSLHLLPIQSLKIDLFLLWKMGQEQKSDLIIQMILTIASQLQVQVIFDGVEDEEHWQYVRTRDCDMAQGYFFYKPLSQDAFGALLSQELLFQRLPSQELPSQELPSQ